MCSAILFDEFIHPGGYEQLGLFRAAFWSEVGYTLATVTVSVHSHLRSVWSHRLACAIWTSLCPTCKNTSSSQSTWCLCFGTAGGNWRNSTKTPWAGSKPQAWAYEAAVLTSGQPCWPRVVLVSTEWEELTGDQHPWAQTVDLLQLLCRDDSLSVLSHEPVVIILTFT